MKRKTFLVVFHGQWKGNKIFDISNDPCFDDPPSWGICRPPTRKALDKGDTLFFLAKIENEYYLKGWFEVGNKINYIVAMTKFPSRQNVIISKSSIQRPPKWRYKELKENYQLIYSLGIPNFLLNIKTTQGTFYQNPIDDHEIDNWKCRRILNCRKNDFYSCIKANKCLKDGCSLSDDIYKNYVIADENNWDDIDYLRITFQDICSTTGFDKPIETPRHQHNILRFDDYKQILLDYISKRKEN